MDSNGQGINDLILMKGVTCQRFYCPTLPDAISLVKRAEVIKAPNKIYIQIGVNDLEHSPLKDIEQEMDALTFAINVAFPNAKILVSAVLARRDLIDKREATNQLFEQLCAKYPNVMQFVAQQNLAHPSVLRDSDSKHLHGGGFGRMLSNIRFALFGLIPSQRR